MVSSCVERRTHEIRLSMEVSIGLVLSDLRKDDRPGVRAAVEGIDSFFIFLFSFLFFCYNGSKYYSGLKTEVKPAVS